MGGETLVVESFGFNDRTWLDHDGHPHTEGAPHDRTLPAPRFGHLEVEVTLSDPKTYSKPWTVAVRAELAADTEMLEWVCNEGRSGLEHWVGKASDERKGEVQVAPEILSKYIGTYEEQQPYWRAAARVVESLSQTADSPATWTAEGDVPLIATSDAAFTACMGSASSSSKAAQAGSLSSTYRATTGSPASELTRAPRLLTSREPEA